MEATKQELVAKTDKILARIQAIDKERLELMTELKSFFPIKEGDKVEVMKDDVHVRFAFVNKIEVNLRGKDPKARIEFDLQKCKLNGEISQHADHLGAYEYITRIKK